MHKGMGKARRYALYGAGGLVVGLLLSLLMRAVGST
jgi:hypothetical protein